ncbi:MAG: ElyC/SanA/YdcF family protein [Bdellovibrionota bacterium]
MNLRPRYRLLSLIVGSLGIGFYTCDRFVARAAEPHIIEDVSTAEPAPAALVLGTSKLYGNSPNVFFYARLEAAADLYEAGKVKKIILSGNGPSNEPGDMKDVMISLRVPEDALILDGEGYRTIDSVRRAKQTYQFDHVIIVSQRFHIERALFLAQHFGLTAEGYAAYDAPLFWHLKVRAREVLARAMAVYEASSE